MKKISNVEVKLINLSANDILCSSPNSLNNEIMNSSQLVGARGYYDDEEEIW